MIFHFLTDTTNLQQIIDISRSIFKRTERNLPQYFRFPTDQQLNTVQVHSKTDLRDQRPILETESWIFESDHQFTWIGSGIQATYYIKRQAPTLPQITSQTGGSILLRPKRVTAQRHHPRSVPSLFRIGNAIRRHQCLCWGGQNVVSLLLSSSPPSLYSMPQLLQQKRFFFF